MIANIFLIVICVVIVGFIIYGIYNKKYKSGINNTENKNLEPDDDDTFTDKLSEDQLDAFYKLFTSSS
ncbi:IMV membrane protein [Hypsugopox virus]|nr:IMV membrane protein [Hypsugopox virus]